MNFYSVLCLFIDILQMHEENFILHHKSKYYNKVKFFFLHYILTWKHLNFCDEKRFWGIAPAAIEEELKSHWGQALSRNNTNRRELSPNCPMMTKPDPIDFLSSNLAI